MRAARLPAQGGDVAQPRRKERQNHGPTKQSSHKLDCARSRNCREENGDEPAQMLLQATPGGFERFVIEVGQPLTDPIAPPDIPKLIEIAARYGVDILGPLPDGPS